MNMLIDLLPTSVKVDNKEYKINSDFRTSMLFEMMMLDGELDKKEKITNALQLYYPIAPTNINEAVKKLIWFYSCGKDNKKHKGTGSTVTEQIYSYEYDDSYIYSAFLTQYNIDLQDIEFLHWWKFKAMFKSLKDDNMIVKIMGYRSLDINSIKDKEQKANYRKLKKIYELPKNKTEVDKLNIIEKALLNGGNVEKILNNY